MTISDCSIALPVGPHVIPSDIGYILKSFKKVMSDRRNSIKLRNILVVCREWEDHPDV